MATVTEAQSLRVAKALGLHHKPTIELPEAASQTFKKGAIVIWSSGYVTEATDNDPTEIIGIADEPGDNGTSAGDETTKVIPALPHIVFEGILGNNGDDLYELAATDVGSVYGVAKDATNGGWYVDQDETTSVRVRVIKLKDDVGTVNGRVYFTFLVAANMDGGASEAAVSGLIATET